MDRGGGSSVAEEQLRCENAEEPRKRWLKMRKGEKMAITGLTRGTILISINMTYARAWYLMVKS